jgi:predicted dehydrogenase
MVTIGFLGYGYWGPNVLRNFYQNPRARVLKAFDINESNARRLQEQYPTLKVVSSMEEIIHDPAIDAVGIATPAFTHYELSRMALEAGKHVFVEKPIALTVDEADRLIELALARNLVLMVGHVYKYSVPVQKVKKIIDSGELGSIHYAQANRTSLGPRVRNDVNVVWDYAIHDLYLAMYFFGGKPSSARAWGKRCLNDRIEDAVMIDLGFPNGVRAWIHCSWYEPVKTRNLTIVGSQQMLIYDEVPPEEKIIIYRRGFAPFSGTDRLGNVGLELFDEGLFVPHLEWQEPLRLECHHFITCVLEGKTPLSDGLDGKQTLEIIYAVNESLRRNGEEVSIA